MVLPVANPVHCFLPPRLVKLEVSDAANALVRWLVSVPARNCPLAVYSLCLPSACPHRLLRASHRVCVVTVAARRALSLLPPLPLPSVLPRITNTR